MDIYSAISQNVEAMLSPPISNLGVKGIRRTAKEIFKWPNLFNDRELRMNLFSVYIFIEIGGTGGGSFRYIYSRFLKEAAKITSERALEEAAGIIWRSGELLTDFALLFKDAETDKNILQRIEQVPERLNAIADLEEKAFYFLEENIPKLTKK